MPLRGPRGIKTKAGIGAIGHVATIDEYKGQGYGSMMVEAFKDECKKYAKERNETFLGLAGEVEDDAKNFFYYKHGFL